jgi:tetratricopeptide (TPR) repeat protein
MKRLLNILVFFCLTSTILAQEETRVVDSLQVVLATQEGREKVETMIELSKVFFDLSFDDCIDWGEKAVKEAIWLQDEELIAMSYWKIGLLYLNHFELDLAHEQFDKAYKILRNKGDSELLMRVLNFKGGVELFMGEMDSALITLQYNQQVSENLGDELNYADVLNNMAYIHFQRDDLDKAMECFQDARQRYVQGNDTLSMAQCDNNISNIYVQWQQYDKAMSLLQNAIPIFAQNDDEASLAHAYQNLGTVFATGIVDFDSAMIYLRKSIICAESVDDQMTLAEDEIELANVLKRLNRDKEAVSLYQSALHVSEAMGFQKGLLDAYRHLGIHYNEKGDFTTSAIYLKRCMDLASKKGNKLYVNSIRPYLISDYAHLGHYTEMSKELGLFMDNYESFVSESDALDKELERVRENAEGILSQYESQNKQLVIMQTQLSHYRLAFFGCLAIVLAVLLGGIIWRLLKHYFSRDAKSSK